ncbi:MAG: hypothetical protein WBB39_00070 [Candidatus Saccharimonadales bacterium]
MKKTPSNKQGRLSPTKIIVLIVTAVLVILPVWNWYVHYQDKQKFMTLKQDMLSLQTEFNKIDSGWTYSESCNSSGEKFKQNQASSCGVELKIQKSVDVNKYQKIMHAASITDKYVSYDFMNGDDKVIGFDSSYVKNSKVKCGLSSRSSASSVLTSVGCHDSALDFYFPKTQ